VNRTASLACIASRQQPSAPSQAEQRAENEEEHQRDPDSLGPPFRALERDVFVDLKRSLLHLAK
jgi:hypothetical protein